MACINKIHDLHKCDESTKEIRLTNAIMTMVTVRMLVDIIKTKNLETLHLINCMIHLQDYKRITDALATNETITEFVLYIRAEFNITCYTTILSGIQKNKSITHLEVQYNGLYDTNDFTLILTDIINNNIIKTLGMRYDKIHENATTLFANAITNNTSLTELDLSGTFLNNKQPFAILDALKNNKSIKNLALGRNAIDDEMVSIIDLSNTVLTHLDLTCNDIGPVGAKIIANALMYNTSLKYINLYNNFINIDGLTEFINAVVYNNTLTDFHIGHDRWFETEDILTPLADKLAFKWNLKEYRINSHNVRIINNEKIKKSLKSFAHSIDNPSHEMYHYYDKKLSNLNIINRIGYALVRKHYS